MLGDQIASELESYLDLQPFQREWLRESFEPGIAISAMSVARGNGKTALLGALAGLTLKPESVLFREGLETLVIASSLEQGRILNGFSREVLNGPDYRHMDSSQRIQTVHVPTRTRLRVMSSDPRRVLGLSKFGLILLEEVGAWEPRNGAQMISAVESSVGKLPDQRILIIGTVAPSQPGSWWPEMLTSGSGNGVHVQVIEGDRKLAWDEFENVRRANPLMAVSKPLETAIRRELKAARLNPTKQRSFEAYRLNWHVATDSEMLCELPDWRDVEARPVPPRKGRAIIAVDCGEKRSWTGVVCLWENGRSECFACCGSIPNLEERTRQDGQPEGTYQRLQDEGSLIVDEGRKVARPEVLLDHILGQGIRPASILTDRFMHDRVSDWVRGRFPLHRRISRWSESTSDIADFRSMVQDGPLSIAVQSRKLALLSLACATVETDSSGNVRLIKKSKLRSRDDVAVSACLAAGAFARESRKQPRRRVRLAA